jgi:malate synthase
VAVDQHPDAALDDGRKITLELFRAMVEEEMEKIQTEVGETVFNQVKYVQAAGLFDDIIAADTLAEFLTLAAYDHLEG